MEEYKEIERSIITKYRKDIWSKFVKAVQDYKLINEYNKYKYVVLNDNIIYATNKVDAILLASKCSVDRIESLDLQTEEEIIHEILIS